MFWNRINVHQTQKSLTSLSVRGPKHITSCFRQGGGSVETGSLALTDDLTADSIGKINSEVYWAFLSAHIQPNVTTGRSFTVQTMTRNIAQKVTTLAKLQRIYTKVVKVMLKLGSHLDCFISNPLT